MEKEMAKGEFQAVVFDFDYTLADSSLGAMQCINYALKSLVLPVVNYEKVCQTIGMCLVETYAALGGQKNSPEMEKFISCFIEKADEVMVNLTNLYDTVPKMTQRLKQRDLTLGILSNKNRYRIEAILKRESLCEEFEAIVGAEDVFSHKPDPQGLKLVMEMLGVSPEKVLYVGDSVIDAETARRANVPFVAILSGVTKRSDFSGYNCYKMVEDLTKFTDWLVVL